MTSSVKGKDMGWLTFELGNMYGGKTEGLITQLLKLERVNGILEDQDQEPLKIKAYKHAVDDRYEVESISTHLDGGVRRTYPASPIVSVDTLVQDVTEHNVRVIGIDEIQFFQETDSSGEYKIVQAIERFIDEKRHVIVAGLNRDFRKKPFGPVPFLLSMAHTLNEHYSLCAICGEKATETQRLIDGRRPARYNDPIIQVGSSDTYEARCMKHHEISR